MYCTAERSNDLQCTAERSNDLQCTAEKPWKEQSKMEEQRRLVAKLINDHNAANSTHNAVKKVSHKVDPTLYYLTIIQLE